MLTDSFEKLVDYFAAVTIKPFEFKGTMHKPKPLLISKKLVRGFMCPANCGGCCFRFSLDFLPSEQHPEVVRERKVSFNGSDFTLLTDFQSENKGKSCKYVNSENGRCLIHGTHPFSCIFEPLRFKNYKQYYVLGSFHYGRGWSYNRVDGKKGALCKFYKGNLPAVTAVRNKLARLKEWTDYFGLETRIPEILASVEQSKYKQIVLM